MKGAKLMNAIVNEKDEITMKLVHYFVTEENYTPINVQGAKDEIWLENLDGPYKIIRINSKYIHNNEQLNFDLYKMSYVIKQIKRKTLSFKMNVLNICLDLGNAVKLDEKNKVIDTVNVESLSDIKKNNIIKNVYPKIKNMIFKKNEGIEGFEDFIHITEDINNKTQKDNKKYEQVFKPKKIIMTKIIMLLCLIMYIVTLIMSKGSSNTLTFILLGANNRELVLQGEVFRLITYAFLHGNLIHLIVNMYSLWVIGSQVENYIGRWKFLVIYLLSALMGGLMSVVFLNDYGLSVGASGAIFGLMGSLLYFGYHYRLYLSTALTSQIIPIIIVNLILGFALNGIDNACHIGGLIGGYLATMIVGIKYKSKKEETINGIIVYILLLAFLVYAAYKFA